MSLLNICSCGKKLLFIIFLSFSTTLYPQIFFNDLEGLNHQKYWIGLSTIDSGSAHSGYYLSHTDSLNPYGLGMELLIPQELSNENVLLSVEGYVRSKKVNNDAIFVITILDSLNEGLLWKGVDLSNTLKTANDWYDFNASIKIPRSIIKNSKIKAFLWNRNSETDMDDLKLEFSRCITPSFLPNYQMKINDDLEEVLLFKNNYYSIWYSDKKISFRNKSDNIIIEDLYFNTDRVLKDNPINGVYGLNYKGKKVTSEGVNLNFDLNIKWGKVKVVIQCNKNSGRLDINIEEKYKKKQIVNREAIAIQYNQEINEVYRSNRKIESKPFQSEYWLDREGLMIGDKSDGFVIYHTPKISSIQADVPKKIIYLNLDYNKDHPFFRFPLNPDSNNWKVDQSYSKYVKSTRREFEFSIYIGHPINTIPRFMKNPNGYEASYIWTEHADFTNIRTNRATYFGSEKITSSDNSTGGFVYYNIPVTKSVFYDNPDTVTNFNASSGLFIGAESAILTDDEFASFLFDLNDKGYDICLHTPDHFTTTPKRLDEALEYMSQNFSSPTWIDHGNNNGPENNREDLICDATVKGSPFYSVDKWGKNGIRYLHNAYYEEMNTFQNWQFPSSLEKPFSGYGDFFPKPDYYQHNSLTNNLFHWSTSSVLFINDPYMWDYLFNNDKIESMIENGYVEINHVYPAWVNQEKGMWTYDKDSVIIAHPGFNEALNKLSQQKMLGRLNITTIADFLDYRTSIDNIEYNINPDGRVQVSNNNDYKISGLSMVVEAKSVTVDGTIPQYKKASNDIIFWFDLDSYETKIIRFID